MITDKGEAIVDPADGLWITPRRRRDPASGAIGASRTAEEARPRVPVTQYTGARDSTISEDAPNNPSSASPVDNSTDDARGRVLLMASTFDPAALIDATAGDSLRSVARRPRHRPRTALPPALRQPGRPLRHPARTQPAEVWGAAWWGNDTTDYGFEAVQSPMAALRRPWMTTDGHRPPR